eukprot:562323-Hanusia_phi.AAC.1
MAMDDRSTNESGTVSTAGKHFTAAQTVGTFLSHGNRDFIIFDDSDLSDCTDYRSCTKRAEPCTWMLSITILNASASTRSIGINSFINAKSLKQSVPSKQCQYITRRQPDDSKAYLSGLNSLFFPWPFNVHGTGVIT